MKFEKKLIMQILKFGIVGVIATGIDFGLLWLFRDIFKWNLLLSNALSFTISLLVNYVLSMHFVFEASERLNKQQQFLIFVLSSLVGLAINELIMWLGVMALTEKYKMLVKVGATGVVMVYNFISKKLLLERKKKEVKKDEEINIEEIR